MLELGKASSSVCKNYIFKNVPVVKKVAYLLKFFLKPIPHILYDEMKLFMTKILKLIDDD